MRSERGAHHPEVADRKRFGARVVDLERDAGHASMNAKGREIDPGLSTRGELAAAVAPQASRV
jgi:hypothetical protein